MLDIKKTILEIIEEAEVNMDGVSVVFDNDIDKLSICTYVRYNNVLGFAVDVSDAIDVKFNIKAIEKNIKDLFMFKRLINKATRPYLKHLVLHELRHVWQTKNNKALLVTSENSFGLNGYGQIPAEADANSFARSKCNTKFETFVSDVFTYCQDMHNKSFKTTKDMVTGIKYILKLYGYAIL